MASDNSQPQGSSSPAKPVLRKPVFTKIDNLKPGTTGLTLVVKVLSSEIVLQKGRAASPNLRNVRIAECLVGDETGSILFTARNDQVLVHNCVSFKFAECLVGDETGSILFTVRNDQVDLMKPGTSVIIRNGKIDMFKGSMRLAVDRWGRIEVTEPVTFEVKEDNNLSLVEYELVKVAD